MWLRYKNTGDTAVAYQFTAEAEERPERAVEAGRTLRGVDYDFLLSKRSVWDVAIGADELQPTGTVDVTTVSAGYGFILAWYTAEERWFSPSTGSEPSVASDPFAPGATDFRPVSHPAGVAPIAFIEGVRFFPSLTLTLTERYPTRSS